jgi:hypothetical protein
MRPLTITLTPDVFRAVLAGTKRTITTRRNPRKDRYFQAKTPDQAKVNGIPYQINRVEGTPEEWVIHIGNAL